MGDSETLQRIEQRVNQLDQKIDRLLVGGPGDEGLLTRVARVEERQGRIAAFYAWVLAAGAAIMAWLIPGSHRTQQ